MGAATAPKGVQGRPGSGGWSSVFRVFGLARSPQCAGFAIHPNLICRGQILFGAQGSGGGGGWGVTGGLNASEKGLWFPSPAIVGGGPAGWRSGPRGGEGGGKWPASRGGFVGGADRRFPPVRLLAATDPEARGYRGCSQDKKGRGMRRRFY